jgi:NADH-quinone oxidoreductase subunit A
LSGIFGPRRRTAVKDEPFECGLRSIGPNRARFHPGYYVLAILLIVFDIEVAFMVPWAVLFRKLGVAGFVEMMVFIGILAAGFAYLWMRGGLEIGGAGGDG